MHIPQIYYWASRKISLVLFKSVPCFEQNATKILSDFFSHFHFILYTIFQQTHSISVFHNFFFFFCIFAISNRDLSFCIYYMHMQYAHILLYLISFQLVRFYRCFALLMIDTLPFYRFWNGLVLFLFFCSIEYVQYDQCFPFFYNWLLFVIHVFTISLLYLCD